MTLSILPIPGFKEESNLYPIYDRELNNKGLFFSVVVIIFRSTVPELHRNGVCVLDLDLSLYHKWWATRAL